MVDGRVRAAGLGLAIALVTACGSMVLPTAVVQTAVPAAKGASADRAQAVARARGEAQRVLGGSDREELASLLQSAEQVPDEAQRYAAYLGAWQYARLIYLQKGSTAEQKAVLDAIQAVAQTFPQYQASQFELRR